MDKADSIFYIGRDQTPDIKGCIIHPWLKIVRRCEQGPKAQFGGIHYGLCKDCLDQLLADQDFQNEIDREIDTRIKQLATRLN